LAGVLWSVVPLKRVAKRIDQRGALCLSISLFCQSPLFIIIKWVFFQHNKKKNKVSPQGRRLCERDERTTSVI